LPTPNPLFFKIRRPFFLHILNLPIWKRKTEKIQLRKSNLGAGGVVQLVEPLPSKSEGGPEFKPQYHQKKKKKKKKKPI
jgi:hypothetical protein